MPYIIDNTPKIDRWETKFKIYQWEESPLSFFQHLNCSKNAGFGIIAHLRTTPKLTNPSWQLQCCSGNQWSNLKWKKKKSLHNKLIIWFTSGTISHLYQGSPWSSTQDNFVFMHLHQVLNRSSPPPTSTLPFTLAPCHRYCNMTEHWALHYRWQYEESEHYHHFIYRTVVLSAVTQQDNSWTRNRNEVSQVLVI